MIKVYVKKEGNFPVSTPKIKKSLQQFLSQQGIVSNADLNILIVGKVQMEKLGRKYLSKKEPVHNVLSFVAKEAKENFVNPPDDTLHLGDIAICFPIAAKEAGEEEILMEEKVIELLQHGAYHLLGIHHN